MLTRPLTTLIEAAGKHWVSEIECTQLILWQNQWQQVQTVVEPLREAHRESFRPKKVRCRNGDIRQIWAFSKVVRLKKYGRKRLVIVHETADLSDLPRFLLTDALHWDSSRVFSTWSFRWPIETSQPPIGQRVYSLSREAVQQVVELTQVLLRQGKSVEHIMEVLMPA